MVGEAGGGGIGGAFCIIMGGGGPFMDNKEGEDVPVSIYICTCT